MNLGVNGKLDLVVIGGGIAGAAMATVMARRGARVAVLERQVAYRDHVRGEFMQPWGVAEAQQLQLCDVFEKEAGGVFAKRNVPFDELRPPEVALALAQDMGAMVPGVAGGLCAGHPASCVALIEAAETADAEVRRGVDRVRVMGGIQPEVRFELDGTEHRLECALVIGADGRTSSVRTHAGIPLRQAPATHLVCGLLVDGVADWPQDIFTLGTQDEVMFFVFPQGGERLRLYVCTALDQSDRFAGPNGPARLLETFRTLTAIPQAEAIANGTPIGPCATLTGEDSWTDVPFAPGIALIGDAAGYNDPIIGQGLSLALCDVRVLSNILLENQDWSSERLAPYAQERHERMRRMRFTASLMAALFSTFGPEGRERRKRFGQRLREDIDPELKFAFAATAVGPDNVPAFAFDESMRARVLDA